MNFFRDNEKMFKNITTKWQYSKLPKISVTTKNNIEISRLAHFATIVSYDRRFWIALASENESDALTFTLTCLPRFGSVVLK